MSGELKNLYEQKRTALESLKQIAETAKTRSLSREETINFSNLESEINQLNGRIETINSAAQREVEMLISGDKVKKFSGNGDDEFSKRVKSGSFRESKTGKDIPVLNRNSKANEFETFVRSNYDVPKHLDGISFGRLAKALLFGPQDDIEERALSEGTNSAGGYTVPSIVSAQLIDRLRPASHVMALGANMVGMENGSKETSMAKLTGGITVEWLAENAQSAESDPTFGQVKWQFKTLRALVLVSRELMEDSLNIDEAINLEVVKSFASELDRVSLLGSGTGAQPKGIVNFANINTYSMGTNGAALTNFSPIVAAAQLIAEDNASDPTGAVMSPRSYAAFANLADTTGQPLRRPFTIENLPFRQTTTITNADTQGTANNASKIFIGDYTQLYWGIRNGIQIIPLNQRYADYNQVGFLAVMRADLQPYHEQSFTKIIGVIP